MSVSLTLEQRLIASNLYNRLNQLPTPGSTRTFSVRNQSNDSEGVRQSTAVNFMDSGDPPQIQREFTVNQSRNTLSITGRRKSDGSAYTKYTQRAQDYYDILVTDTNLKNYRSQLVHKYSQSDASKQYKQIKSNTAGVQLVYNPA